MLSRDFLGPFVDHNPDYSGVAWDTFGASVSHIDEDDATGYSSENLLGEASLAHTLTLDDGTIPDTATIRALTIRFRLGDDALGAAGALGVVPYIRYTGGSPTFQELVAPAHVVAFNEFEVEFPRDPDGLPWSRRSLYRKRGKLLRFGLRSQVSSHPSARIRWTECLFRPSFDLATPLVVTDPATLIGDDSAVANGRINPQGANATYPLSYYFEFGQSKTAGRGGGVTETTLVYTRSTAHVAGVTGDVDLVVSTTLGEDSPRGITDRHGPGWHFQLVVDTPDGTFRGGDQFFNLDPAATGRWRLDEFKRIPTGVDTASDRTRITSFGFDRTGGFADDCPFLEFP